MSAPSAFRRGPFGIKNLPFRPAALWAPARARRQVWRRSAVAIRLVVALAGLAVMLAPEHPKPLFVLVIGVGVAVAAYSPDRAGAATAMIAGIGGWFASYGEHGDPPVARVLWFAVALYLLHSSTALAAAVSVSSEVDGRTLTRWARRWLLHVAIAGVLAAACYRITAALHAGRSEPLQLAGLVGTVLILSVIGWLFSRSTSRPS